MEWTEQFEKRKRDHIRLALTEQTQTLGASGLQDIELLHEALPELNFDEISIAADFFGRPVQSPLFVSSMTAGHGEGRSLNRTLALACEKRGWAMGVGSQRRELQDPEAQREWAEIRQEIPGVVFMGNIGIAELISSPIQQITRLTEALKPSALIVHLNPLQECLQPEGSPRFRGGYAALERLINEINLPVVVKETGCGFSRSTLDRLARLPLAAIDVSGKGGTHWGRVEGLRSEPDSPLRQIAETFRDWGVGTVSSLRHAVDMGTELGTELEIWASGGVRTGLDAAKLLALGARRVGFAQPMMAAALSGLEALEQVMIRLETELKVAMFCTGLGKLSDFGSRKVWTQK